MAQHFYGLDDVAISNAWLTIGSFDGVHRGHQQIIDQLTAGAHAHGSLAVALTFEPHPAAVLKDRTDGYELTSPQQRAARMFAAGVDTVITHPFNQQVAELTARQFVDQLTQAIQFSNLLVGYDFALGKDRQGNPQELRAIGAELGFEVHEVPAYELNGDIVSSSRIRQLLWNSQIEAANQLLGYSFALAGKVVHGDGRGGSIGIPTANLELPASCLIPNVGVYACQVRVDDILYPAAVNIGLRPTFETRVIIPRVEAHILDFSGQLYDHILEIEFLAHLRPEQKFDTVDTLVAQIRQDIADTQNLFDQRHTQ